MSVFGTDFVICLDTAHKFGIELLKLLVMERLNEVNLRQRQLKNIASFENLKYLFASIIFAALVLFITYTM